MDFQAEFAESRHADIWRRTDERADLIMDRLEMPAVVIPRN